MNHITGLLSIVVLLSANIASAGSLDSPAPVDDPASAMHSISNLCERLQSGAPGVKRDTPFSEPATGPGSTNCTLDEAMSSAPALDDTDGATAAKVLVDHTYWGLRNGEWGLQTGTMPNNAGESASLSQSASGGTNKFTAAEGYYDGADDSITATDSEITGLDNNIQATNIACGVTIFGVTGAGVGGLSISDCGIGCTDLASNINNCGNCDVTCGSNETCEGGSCRCGVTAGSVSAGPACGADTCCGSSCANLSTDINNCGLCGKVCDPSESCDGGMCVPIE